MIALAMLLLLHPAMVRPVLELPERGLDDTAAYQGYRTRIFRDGAGDAVQIILDRRRGRVVLMWADAADESAAFSARDTSGAPAALDWGSSGAEAPPTARAARSGGPRRITWRLELPGEPVDFGHFALGSMRWERDLQYQHKDLAPFDSELPPVPEPVELTRRLEQLEPAMRERCLALLHAPSIAVLEERLRPGITLSRGDSVWTVRVAKISFDGRNHLTLEISGVTRACEAQVRAGLLRLRPRRAGPFALDIRVSTDAAALTPIGRDRIFTADFLAFCDRIRRDPAAGERARRLERQLRGMELVSYEEKLMAGLPNFATYFGRDMLMTALMMEPVWRPEMLEHVVASALRKLSPAGEVSHEEALGGQAIRESAGEATSCLAAAEATAGASRDSLLARAMSLIGDLARVRENYRMADESLQLPVVAARYLAHPHVTPAAKRVFLRASAGPGTRLAALLRNFDHVLSQATPYAVAPEPTRLVSFAADPDGGWTSGSWRDSRAGYAGGRFAMDVNVLWMPRALAAIASSLAACEQLGIPADTLGAIAERDRDASLASYLHDPGALTRARERWDAAGLWFEVQIPAAEVRSRIAVWLAWLPDAERRHWSAVVDTVALPDTLDFLALSLDDQGRPIPVMNTDPAGLVFLDPPDPARALEQLGPLLRPYPLGLMVPGLGPLVANDSFASRAVWDAFDRDRYHSSRVVWGRELNLLLLGLARQLHPADDPPSATTLALRRDIDRVRRAAAASGLDYAELWSYAVRDDELRPERYGASSDVQLWSLTDLAVQYALDANGSSP